MKKIEAYFNPATQTQDFRLVDAERVPLGPDDLRVQVKAISVNPVDYKVASSIRSVDSAAKTLGWDAAGTIVEIGSEVRSFQVGEDVYYAGSLVREGSNAQYQIVDQRIVGKKPKTLTFKEAAALPLTTLTAWELLFDHLCLKKDDVQSILILGAAGGVGSIAIRLIKQMTRMKVIGTASRLESEKWIRELGVDEVINHRGNIGEQLKKLGQEQVDYVLCLNDTDSYFPHFAEWVKPMGKVGSIVETTRPVNLDLLKSKSISFFWEFMFTRSMYQTPDMGEQGKILDRVSEFVDSGLLSSTIALDLGDMTVGNLKQAHEILRSGRMIGKIVMGELKG